MDAHLHWADISNNNGAGAFHAHAYKSAGHKLIGLKASEGAGFTDPDHAAWAHMAHAAGLAVVHYHYAKPEIGQPRQQAQRFWETVKPRYLRGRDRLVCDLEEGDPREGVAWLHEFDVELGRLAGDEPHDQLIGYTFLSFFQAAAFQLRSGAWWLAAWGPTLREREALGRGQYLWAQQTSNGHAGPEPHTFAGIRGTCDASVINKRSLSLIERALGRAPLAH